MQKQVSLKILLELIEEKISPLKKVQSGLDEVVFKANRTLITVEYKKNKVQYVILGNSDLIPYSPALSGKVSEEEIVTSIIAYMKRSKKYSRISMTQFKKQIEFSNKEHVEEKISYLQGRLNALQVERIEKVVQIDLMGSPVLDKNGNPIFIKK